MSKRFLVLIVVSAGLGGALYLQRSRSTLSTEAKPTVAVDEKAQGVLRKAAEACKAMNGGSFSAEHRGEGVMANTTKPVRGTVRFDSTKEWLRIAATVSDTGGVERSFDLATDAEKVVGVDHVSKSHRSGTYPFARMLMSPGLSLFMPMFGSEAAFSTDLGRNPKYEGVRNADSTPCDVVCISWGGEATRWYFGQADHLPRRVERIYNLYASKEEVDKTVLTLADIKAGATFAQADFQIAVPDGYTADVMSGPEALLAAGTPAPDWEMKTPQGQTVRLSQLRGNVVVLDFWATWCGPCKMAMPKVQELHTQYEGQRVKVFGVNCMEDKNGDPAGYMKVKNYTYGLLLEGDNTARAYHVSGIPTFYVIDPKGNIVHAQVGAGEEAKLSEAVKKALTNEET